MVPMMERFTPLVCVGGIVLVWWLQPGAMYYLLNLLPGDNASASEKMAKENRCRLATAGYLCVSMFFTAALGSQLHVSLRAGGVFVKPMLFIVLWYTSAMQFLRYMHLLSVGPTVFRRHFGLTSWKRTQLFMWSAPTIQFLPVKKQNATTDDLSLFVHHSASSELSWSHLKFEARMALWDVVGMEVLCGAVLLFRWGEILPLFLQSLIRVYIMGFSTAVLKILLECPSYYYILRCTQEDMVDTEIRIFPIYNRPWLTSSPRELWHRWSVTAGYHLRLGLYDPVLGLFRRQRQPEGITKPLSITTTTMMERLVATAAPFAVNCMFHITWWSIVVKCEIDYIYTKLLFVYPLVSFAIQDSFAQMRMKRPNPSTTTNTATSVNSTATTKQSVPLSLWRHTVLNILLMWIGFILIGEPMSLAHGLHSKLTNVARANLLMPPLPPPTTF